MSRDNPGWHTPTMLSLTALLLMTPNPELLNRIHARVQDCVVQPTVVLDNGKRVVGPLISQCDDVIANGEGRATLQIDGQTFEATLVENTDADGGDLFDLEIRDGQGVLLAQQKAVLCFGDVLMALSGQSRGFREE